MKDPERLLAQGATEFERRLLQAVKNERPSPELQLRMEQALGLTGAAAPAAGAVAKAWHASWLKLAMGGLVAGGLAASGLVHWSPTGAAHRPEPGVATTEVVPPSLASAPTPIGPGDEVVDPSGAVSARTEGVDLVKLRDEVNLFEEATLRHEIELLDAVRAELSRGRAAGAKLALDRYERRFPAGALQREAQVLRGRMGGAAGARRVDPGAASRR